MKGCATRGRLEWSGGGFKAIKFEQQASWTGQGDEIQRPGVTHRGESQSESRTVELGIGAEGEGKL